MRECLFLGGPRDGQRLALRPGPVPVGEVCQQVIELAGYRPAARLDRGGVLQEVYVWTAGDRRRPGRRQNAVDPAPSRC